MQRYKPEYLQAFGLLEIEWNRIEGELFHIFYQLCGARIDKAHAIFFSQINHRARREMVEAVALYALADRPRLRRELGSLMRRLRNAAAKRNEIIHTIWEWDGGEQWGFMPMDGDLSGEDPLAEISSRTETISALYQGLSAFHRRIYRRRSLSAKSPIPTPSGRALLMVKPVPKVRRAKMVGKAIGGSDFGRRGFAARQGNTSGGAFYPARASHRACIGRLSSRKPCPILSTNTENRGISGKRCEPPRH